MRFVDGHTLPIRKILGVARNYRSHAAEMGSPVPEAPVFFLKPATAVIHDGEAIVLPPQSKDVQVETELAVILAGGGKDVPESEAMKLIGGYAVFFDITARDLQAAAKKAGLPWTASKGFDTFAPIGDAVSVTAIPDPAALHITLRVNGQVRQDADTSDMVFGIPRLIHSASHVMMLEEGDLLATGTPSGVCTITAGDALEATISGLPPLRSTVRAA